jgi:hypothetical protein
LAGGGAFHRETGVIEQHLLGWGGVLRKVEGSFEAAGSSEEGAAKQGDDAGMGDDKTRMVTLPGPAGGGGADEVEAEEQKPKVKPGGSVDVGAGDPSVESGLKKGGSSADPSEGNQEEDSKIEGA